VIKVLKHYSDNDFAVLGLTRVFLYSTFIHHIPYIFICCRMS